MSRCRPSTQTACWLSPCRRLRKPNRNRLPSALQGKTPAACQDLAPTTHVYTSPKKRGKALLEWDCQGMQRVEADADQPSASPPRDPRHRVHFLEQAHQPIAL